MFRKISRFLALIIAALVVVIGTLVIAPIIKDMQASPAQAALQVAEAGGVRFNLAATQVVSATVTVTPTVSSPSTPVVVPVVPTVTPVPAYVEPCRLDKIGTFSEIEDAGRQRIEVGGHTTQHFDFYPEVGVGAISYIVPEFPNPFGVPGIWMGHGSIWQAPDSLSCASYDWLADATSYATARMDSGHSGLVVDLRGPAPTIVANVGSLTTQEAEELLQLHMLSWGGTLSGVPGVSCDFGVRADRPPEVDVPWAIDPTGYWIILNGWSNQPLVDQSEWKLLLHPDDPAVALLAGGSSWSWPDGCETTVMDEFASNPLPEVTLADLEAMGLYDPPGP